MDVCLRIAGEAGQGVVSGGDILSEALAGMGLHVTTARSYMSRIRGGLNWYDIRVGDRDLYAPASKADVLVALSGDAVEVLKTEMTGAGLIILDGEESDLDNALALDFAQISEDAAGDKRMTNIVALGAVFGVLDYPLEALTDAVKKEFQDKDEDVIKANAACAEAGRDAAGDTRFEGDVPQPADAPRSLFDGASAIGLSAATAGVKFAAAYPMSPATATFAFLAGRAAKYGMVVEQAEDELAAVNMICGAAYAGVPAMTMTSGGGFALMNEGLSLAGMMELPVVIVIAQRPGPATGLPTRTGQEDLRLAINGGHGEFPRAVFAPGTLAQCHDLTRHALEIAHRHQTPVILLTDQYLQDLRTNTKGFDEKMNPIDRCLPEDVGDDYQRYALSDSGVSPRAIPGGEALVVCDSDEHDQDGHLCEDLDVRIEQQRKRMGKMKGLLDNALEPVYHGPDDPDQVLVCWGSTFGACREAAERLNHGKPNVGMLHFAQVWPIDIDAVNETLDGVADVFCVEGNYQGLFAGVLKEIGLKNPCRSVTRYDGLPFTADHIIKELKQCD